MATVLTGLSVCGEPQNPPRLKRADSFLGMHFDFHAGPDCKEVGKNTTPAMIENIIDLVHPDYLQIDSKGHPGYTSYPTKVGNPVPGFVGDPLRVWRDVTARRGVSLYMHYSGVWDQRAIELHPEWAVIDGNGKPNTKITSRFGGYADRLLIPQLRELAGDYGVDGIWTDGECWASVPDYSEAAAKAFRDASGFQELPRKPGEAHWYEFLQFHRQAFRDYLKHYIAEVKKTNPNFQICSNWAFTDHMPEPVCVPVDFLSGDYSPQDSVNSARIAGRYLMRQGVPWDLMAWSFTTKPDKNRTQKTAVQLEREAAVVVALGGGFQAYFKQKRDGSIFDEQMPTMAETAKFCRARQALCHHSQAVPQVALLFSTAAHYRKINGLFSRDNSRISGVLNALLEGQQSVEVLAEHHLTGRMSEYPLIVVPEWDFLEPAFKTELLAYVQNGGNLLLIGPRTAAFFQTELGATLQGEPKAGPVFLTRDGAVAEAKGEQQAAQLSAQATAFGTMQQSKDGGTPQPAASIAKLGKGSVAATYFTMGQNYSSAPSEGVRKFLNDLVRQLFANPIVEVSGTSDVDVCVMRKDGKLLVNLINTSGPHRTKPILEEIAPIGPLKVSIRQENKPAKVTLEPSGKALDFEYRDGKIHLTVPQVAIHEIVVVEAK
jgi:hypothetical protein